MIVRAIRVYVKPEAAEAFERATVENRAGSIKEPGVLRFDVLRARSGRASTFFTKSTPTRRPPRTTRRPLTTRSGATRWRR